MCHGAKRCWQLVLRDESLLSGRAVARMIRYLADCTESRSATVRDVEGGGESLPQLVDWDFRQAEVGIDDLVNMVGRMDQIDWADFVLGPRPSTSGERGHQPDWHAVTESAVVLRCVDDEFFYIYGTSMPLLDVLKRDLCPVMVKQGYVGELDFPR